jgi:hypothetical protein
MGTLREDIFNTIDIERKIVKAWGKDIEVRTMTGGDRANYLMAVTTNSDGNINRKDIVAEVIIWTCFVPGTEDKVFKPEDRDAILAKSAKQTEKLFDAALLLAGLKQEATEEIKNA